MSERDKYLTEAMGECWHKFESHYSHVDKIAGLRCINPECGYHCLLLTNLGVREVYAKAHSGFSTWEGFGKLWEWSQQQEWWESFLIKHCQASHYTHIAIDAKYIHPDRFADAVYEYLKGRDK